MGIALGRGETPADPIRSARLDSTLTGNPTRCFLHRFKGGRGFLHITQHACIPESLTVHALSAGILAAF
jgi:hypothetical protein